MMINRTVVLGMLLPALLLACPHLRAAEAAAVQAAGKKADASPSRIAAAGEISGVVLGHDGDPVPHATLVLCDQDTGIPVSKHTFRPFVEDNLDLKSIAVVATDANGKFLVKNVLGGRYRLLAQSWPGTPAVLAVFEKNGKSIILHGVENGILVPSEKATNIEIKPMGRCVVTLDEDFPNSDALLLVSTEPLSADPVLGFVSWRGPFLQNLIVFESGLKARDSTAQGNALGNRKKVNKAL